MNTVTEVSKNAYLGAADARLYDDLNRALEGWQLKVLSIYDVANLTRDGNADNRFSRATVEYRRDPEGGIAVAFTGYRGNEEAFQEEVLVHQPGAQGAENGSTCQIERLGKTGELWLCGEVHDFLEHVRSCVANPYAFLEVRR